jgi:hypothetical protein
MASEAPDAVSFVVPDVLTMLLQPGESRQISATAYTADGRALTGRQFTWTSSDPSVATVLPSGLVTAIKLGGARITVTAEGRSAPSTRVDVLGGTAYRVVGGLNEGLPTVIESSSYLDSHGLRHFITTILTDGWLDLADTGGNYFQGFQFEVYDGPDQASRGQLVERGTWLDEGIVAVDGQGLSTLRSSQFQGRQGTFAQSATGLVVTQRIANIETEATLLLARH